MRYLFAILGIPSVMVLATLVLHPGALGSLDLSAQPFALPYLIAFVSMAFIGGPLFEEPGWTGFAQPRLQWLYGPLLGSLILGGLWALWHLPLFLSDWGGWPEGSWTDVAWFSGFAISFNVVIAWVFNRTGESLPVVVLLHVGVNNTVSMLWSEIYPQIPGEEMMAGLCVISTVAAVVLIAGRKLMKYRPHRFFARLGWKV